ncbi:MULTISPECIES: low molecular weight phosphatase family protein [Microbacterium]|uniref:Low molecular weight protein-tyrosine-phosphatase etp n=1 Tax=Microbacterium trichothecenolyticum TaxID=69370 RepID=A0A0M2H364_MICTR|nr:MULTISPECIES: low molecular weight phosphatase family protein [Microbacterium]KJL40827.1 Low molecular weight protein-tyrosine-phosphatase etp [Microbacterium trichothecenolyticum]MDR7188712.1 protein-tyrosine phosphatase [Microbacterium sp. BE35]
MFEILTVCTGNICRSPLAEQLLRLRLTPLGARVRSAGTRGLNAAPMTAESVTLATRLGVPADDSAAHRSRFLTEADLGSSDLVLTLAMTRDHRRKVVELAPGRVRSTFTVREFARLSAGLTDDEIRAAAATGADAATRVRATVALIAARRGVDPAPPDPAEDDVIDPYGRSWETYELSAAQLTPAIDETVRVLAAALVTK